MFPQVSLDADKKPTFREIDDAIRSTLEWRKPEQVFELLECMHKQGALEQFTAHALQDALAGSGPNHRPASAKREGA